MNPVKRYLLDLEKLFVTKKGIKIVFISRYSEKFIENILDQTEKSAQECADTISNGCGKENYQVGMLKEIVRTMAKEISRAENESIKNYNEL